MLIWNLPGNLEYLPGCLLDEPGSQIDWNFVTWFSGIPDFSADPYTAHLHYNSARLGCKWDS